MIVKGDPAKPLGEAIKDLLDERIQSCAYYHSWEHEKNTEKSSIIVRKIEKRIGKKLWKQIFRDYLHLEQLQGELHAGLAESCYRLGFEDGLQLANQISEAGKGHLSIFK
ncbi:MAG TPA: hypothetical protein VN456_09545 [Desulfosporosinus sp.]|nr:hypothetical protein [Desulfosporosinus sp.]